MANYTVTVRGFGNVRILTVQAESAREARQKAMADCGISTVTERHRKVQGR